MARIRTIKPEFCTSEQLVECSTNARLLFVLMWLHCDDYGNHPAKLMQLKVECFPGDPFTKQDMAGFMQELIEQELVTEYGDGKTSQTYWHVTGWHHQKIDKPGKRRCPEFVEQSSNPSRTVCEQSSTIRDGRESTVPESTVPKGSGTSHAREAADLPTNVRDAWNQWCEYVFARDGRRNVIVEHQHLMDVFRELNANGEAFVIEAIERSIRKQSKHEIYWQDLQPAGVRKGKPKGFKI